MIRFERAFRHVVEALLKNAQTLAQLFHFQHYAGVAVRNTTTHRDFKVEVFIARIRTRLTHVEVDPGGAQARASGAPLQRLFRAIGGNALGERNYVFAAAVFAVTLLISLGGILLYRHICRKENEELARKEEQEENHNEENN